MTCDQTSPGQWHLSFSEPEAQFLVNVLARMGRHYQEDVSRLPPTLRAYWQGTITRTGVGGDDALKESQEVLALAENWMRDYDLAEDHDPWEVDITGAERDEFVAMLNDRRMLLALEAGITEADMEAELSQISNEARRACVVEIDVLGHFILVMLGPQIHRP